MFRTIFESKLFILILYMYNCYTVPKCVVATQMPYICLPLVDAFKQMTCPSFHICSYLSLVLLVGLQFNVNCVDISFVLNRELDFVLFIQIRCVSIPKRF
jgi:hypothetical protein